MLFGANVCYRSCLRPENPLRGARLLSWCLTRDETRGASRLVFCVWGELTASYQRCGCICTQGLFGEGAFRTPSCADVSGDLDARTDDSPEPTRRMSESLFEAPPPTQLTPRLPGSVPTRGSSRPRSCTPKSKELRSVGGTFDMVE